MTSKQLCICGSLPARFDRLGATKEHGMFATIFHKSEMELECALDLTAARDIGQAATLMCAL
jgi:hypothetical protein